ncbi:energy transducer TonB [Sanyastnella coralliicola]|uniref:energy transducer TonB n=1 Tax=Sanyastnella coralliicola TaxID=3069118 RepID=UPI0027BAD75E|nr:energy transducer TonB [Longitalea sp. SCSIO 12813]
MKNLLFLLSILFLSFSLKADMAPYGMKDVILRTDFAAVGKVLTHDNGEVKIQISTVVMDPRFGLRPGDYMRIQYDPYIVCPSLNFGDIEVGKNLMGFFHKTKDGWRFSFYRLYPERNGEYYVEFPEEGIVYHASAEQWTRSVKAYRNHYKLDEDNRLVEFNFESKPNLKKMDELVLAQYHRFHIDQKINFAECIHIERNEMMESVEPEIKRPAPDSTVYVIADEEPSISDSLSTIQDHIEDCAEKEATFLKEMELEGTAYFHLYLNKEGEIYQVEVARGLHPKFDAKVTECLRTVGPFTPAKLRDRPVLYKMTIPIRVK